VSNIFLLYCPLHFFIFADVTQSLKILTLSFLMWIKSMQQFNPGAELSLGATVVAVVAAWSWHVRMRSMQSNESNENDLHENVTPLGDTTTAGDRTAKRLGGGDDGSGTGTQAVDVEVPQQVSEPIVAVQPPDNLQKVQKEREARARLLQDLHSQLATLSGARADGWSAIFAPLPSSETQEQTESAKRGIVARIRQIEAM
jgi:hypothetical protein